MGDLADHVRPDAWPRTTPLKPYARPRLWDRHRRKGLALLGVAAFSYGALFAITTTYFLLQLAIPFVLLAVLIIWSLPEAGKAPTRLLTGLFWAFLIALLCWPDYLALALPGMPWITAIRLISIPLAAVFLIGLSQSQAFRQELKDILGSAPNIWRLLAAFALIALMSVAFSRAPAFSANKFVVAMLYWVLIFFVATYVFARPGRARTFGYLLWFVAIFVCLIAVQEARHQAVPWAGNIPSFLKIEDETVQRILSAKSRAATGIYRVQSKFTTPLGLAEYLAYAMPFVLHIGLTAKVWWVRVAALATIPLVLQTIVQTDSRLGMVGFFMTFLLYLLAWGVLRWRRNESSVFGPATVLAYPALFAAFIASTFFVGRVHALIWGSAAQSASTESRKVQVAMGLPKIFKRPWGHGIGQGADTLGFTNLAGVLTIDTYYLVVALEYGVLGFVIFYVMFGLGVWNAAKSVVHHFDENTGFIIPLAIAMTNFIIIKSIFSQQENHPLVFAMLGATVGLCYLIRKNRAAPAVRPEPVA